MLKMIYEYKKALRDAKKMYATFNHDNLTLQEESDKKIISSMIRDLEFTIQWLETGRNPDSRRGIDKEGVYSTNPQILDKIHFEKNESDVERELTEDEKFLIKEALQGLTEREKDVFKLIRAEGLTYEYTAELLGIQKTSVQTHLERAEKKIRHQKLNNLFLDPFMVS